MIQDNTYHCYMLCDMERTGDWVITTSRMRAARYFAKKKNIPLRDWTRIYTTISSPPLPLHGPGGVIGRDVTISKGTDIITFSCSDAAPFRFTRKSGNFHFEGRKVTYTMRQLMDLVSGLDVWYMVEVSDKVK